MIDWTLFKWSKGLPGRILRRRQRNRLARQIEACYAEVDERDGEVCRFPGCYRPAAARHHLVFRSQSKALQADASNVIDICQRHHEWIHDRAWVTAAGDANDRVTWEVTDLGRQAGIRLPFVHTTPKSHLFPVGMLAHAERDAAGFPQSPTRRQTLRGPVAGPVSKS